MKIFNPHYVKNCNTYESFRRNQKYLILRDIRLKTFKHLKSYKSIYNLKIPKLLLLGAQFCLKFQ